MGTATFAINNNYVNPRLEVKGGQPVAPKPRSQKPIYNPRQWKHRKETPQKITITETENDYFLNHPNIVENRQALLFQLNSNMKEVNDLPWARETAKVAQIINAGTIRQRYEQAASINPDLVLSAHSSQIVDPRMTHTEASKAKM